jgi:hypothetical protein
MMGALILVVDDNRSIAEGFGGKFRRYAQERNLSADIEVLCDSDQAVRRISDDSMPSLDLLFTDIDFGPGGAQKAGVALARYARTIMPEMPRVGYSGRFEDLAEDEIELFDSWWPKGGSGGKLNDIAEDVLKRAVSHHQDRWSKISQRAGLDSPDSKHVGLVMPRTDQEFCEAGYSKFIIEPSNENGLTEPFAVWIRSSEEGVELEVVACSALFTWGDTYEEAEAGLIELIREMKKMVREPDESFAPSLLAAKRFVQIVTGSRNAVK